MVYWQYRAACGPGRPVSICELSRWDPCWNKEPIRTPTADLSLSVSVTVERHNCFSFKHPFMLKPNTLPPCWQNIFQCASIFFFFQLIRKRGLLGNIDVIECLMTVQGPNLQSQALPLYHSETRDHSVETWSINNFRIRHPSICIDASQWPITAACITRLPKALWYALMNKHLWLIGKCISRVPCCSPPCLLYYHFLASCPSSRAHLPLNTA